MAEQAAVAKMGVDRVVPLRGVRGMIADKMLRSLSEAAQLTHHADCCADALLARKVALAEAGIRVSVEDLILDRVVATLIDHPNLNGVIKGREVYLPGAVHLSVAMELPGSLLVAPTIFNAETLTIEARAAARKNLAERARTNKLTVTEMTSGTFTVSNLGLSRVRYFTPILNTPQIGILGIGHITKVAFPDGKGGVEFRSVMGLSLTFDHRAVDGLPAAAFLSDLCTAIEAA